ncbi:MAG: outer-membrane lipoprotein carrier protein LolA [Bryobacteraceae bacterium]|jgi:outer membrane lipoprotein-sorting protein
MDQAAATFKGMTADVTQVSHTAAINDDETDSGTIAIRRTKPHSMELLMHFKQPDEKIVQFSGQKVEIYYPKSNTVQIYELGKKNTMVQQFLLIGLGSSSEDVRSGYAVKLGGEATVGGQKTVRLELTPKSPDVAKLFQKIEIWVAESGRGAGVAVQQKLHEEGGDYILATYTGAKLEANLPEDAVKFSVPRDAAKSYPQVR